MLQHKFNAGEEQQSCLRKLPMRKSLLKFSINKKQGGRCVTSLKGTPRPVIMIISDAKNKDVRQIFIGKKVERQFFFNDLRKFQLFF